MAEEHHHAPGLPEIHDEAADTPMWLPLLGLTLFALVALFLIVRAAVDDANAGPQPGSVEVVDATE